jgi:hypothetical protein
MRRPSKPAACAVMIMFAVCLVAGVAIQTVRVEMNEESTMTTTTSSDRASSSAPARSAPAVPPRSVHRKHAAGNSKTPDAVALPGGGRRASSSSSLDEIRGEMIPSGQDGLGAAAPAPPASSSLLLSLRRQLVCLAALPPHLLAMYFLGCICLALSFRGLWAEAQDRCARRGRKASRRHTGAVGWSGSPSLLTKATHPHDDSDDEGEGEDSDEIDLICAVDFDAERVMPLMEPLGQQPA